MKTSCELVTALTKNKNTAAGPDEIHYMVIINVPKEVLMLVLNVYNIISSENLFPKQWREATVIQFLKPNKNPKEAKSYRPIALTSCVCKLMERMVNDRLMWILETQRILDDAQYRFRENRSTLDVFISQTQS